MKFFKKRSGAFLTALVIVVLSTLFGAHRSLSQEVRAISDEFYNGVFEDGYMRTSISSQLYKRAAAAMNMLTIAPNYEGGDLFPKDDYTALYEARNELLSLLEAGIGPKTLYEADKALQDAGEKYYASLTRAIAASSQSGAADQENLDSDYNTFGNAARVISESGYNESVRIFHGTVLSEFPANFLCRITFVNPPEYFE